MKHLKQGQMDELRDWLFVGGLGAVIGALAGHWAVGLGLILAAFLVGRKRDGKAPQTRILKEPPPPTD